MTDPTFNPATPFRLTFRNVLIEGRSMWECRVVPHPELLRVMPSLPGAQGFIVLSVPLRCADIDELREAVIALAKSIVERAVLDMTGEKIAFGEPEIDIENMPTAGSA